MTAGGTEVVALRAMPRPFKKLRELDLDDVVAKIVATVK